MATGWVRAGFFHTRTRPASLPLKPGPSLFIKWIFFLTPNTARRATAGPANHATPNPQKKKKKNLPEAYTIAQ